MAPGVTLHQGFKGRSGDSSPCDSEKSRCGTETGPGPKARGRRGKQPCRPGGNHTGAMLRGGVSPTTATARPWRPLPEGPGEKALEGVRFEVCPGAQGPARSGGPCGPSAAATLRRAGPGGTARRKRWRPHGYHPRKTPPPDGRPASGPLAGDERTGAKTCMHVRTGGEAPERQVWGAERIREVACAREKRESRACADRS